MAQFGIGAIEAIKEANKGGGFARAAYPFQSPGMLSWDPKEEYVYGSKDSPEVIFQMLTDNVLPVKIHSYTKCNDGKFRDFACTEALEGDLKRECWICKNRFKEGKDGKMVPVKPAQRIIGLIVPQLTKRGSSVDHTREFTVLSDPNDPDSETKKVEAPAFTLINFGLKSFWEPLITLASKERYLVDGKASLIARPYSAVRSGKGLDTNYIFECLPNDNGVTTHQELWKHYGIKQSDTDRHGDPILTVLYEWIERKGSEAYFNKFLIEGGSSESGSAAADVNDEDLTSYDDAPRVTGSGFDSILSDLGK